MWILFIYLNGFLLQRLEAALADPPKPKPEQLEIPWLVRLL
jgi:hypothetical protein